MEGTDSSMKRRDQIKNGLKFIKQQHPTALDRWLEQGELGSWPQLICFLSGDWVRSVEWSVRLAQRGLAKQPLNSRKERAQRLWCRWNCQRGAGWLFEGLCCHCEVRRGFPPAGGPFLVPGWLFCVKWSQTMFSSPCSWGGGLSVVYLWFHPLCVACFWNASFTVSTLI